LHPSGRFLSSFGKPGFEEGEFQEPRDVAQLLDTNYVVCDYQRSRIAIFSPTGTWLKNIGRGLVRYPDAVAVDWKNGNILVADGPSHAIHLFTASGESLRTIGQKGKQAGQFDLPKGITVDRNGWIIVTEINNCRIQILTNEGKHVTTIGKKGRDNGQIWDPYCPRLDKNGNLIIIDAKNDRIQVFG
jgi:DNA-binding beta-propeller fold protein YncE